MQTFNTYYLPILDKYGYRVLNPSQGDLTLYYKNSFEPLERKPLPWGGHAFLDKKNGGKVEYTYLESIGVRVYEGSRLVIDGNLAKNYQIYNTTAYMEYPSTDTKIDFIINQFPIGTDMCVPGTINVVIRPYGKESKTFRIAQQYNGADLCWPEKELIKSISPFECTTEKYINGIRGFIETNYEGEFDDTNRKIIDTILYSLEKPIDDILTYWKKDVITYAIMIEQEALTKVTDELEIKRINDDIELLKQIQGEQNMPSHFLRG